MTDVKHRFDKDDLISCGHAQMFGPGNAQLPLPPMLMFDRIVEAQLDGGAYGKGRIVAELDIKPDHWFFPCHFEGDPVMPGCLGLDAMWQLTGFFLGWAGAPGRGRALGVKEVKFGGQVRPTAKLVRYEIDIRRARLRPPVLGYSDGVMLVDDAPIYRAKDLKVGLFQAEELDTSLKGAD